MELRHKGLLDRNTEIAKTAEYSEKIRDLTTSKNTALRSKKYPTAYTPVITPSQLNPFYTLWTKPQFDAFHAHSTDDEKTVVALSEQMMTQENAKIQEFNTKKQQEAHQEAQQKQAVLNARMALIHQRRLDQSAITQQIIQTYNHEYVASQQQQGQQLQQQQRQQLQQQQLQLQLQKEELQKKQEQLEKQLQDVQNKKRRSSQQTENPSQTPAARQQRENSRKRARLLTSNRLQSSAGPSAIDRDFFHPVDEALEILEQSSASGLMVPFAHPAPNRYSDFAHHTEDLDLFDLNLDLDTAPDHGF